MWRDLSAPTRSVRPVLVGVLASAIASSGGTGVPAASFGGAPGDAAPAVAAEAAAEAGALRWHLADSGRDVSRRTAGRLCERLEAGGRSDWRLPAVAELESLAAGEEDGAITAALDGAGAWSREVSPSDLAWVAGFADGFLFRVHVSDSRALRALCVSGPPAPSEEEPAAIDEAGWTRALPVDTDSPLLWGCSGQQGEPELVRGSLQSFRRSLPPGPLVEPFDVEFVIGAEGRPRFVGPAPGTGNRLARLAVETLQSFRFEPATCDGRPVPVFYRLSFGGRE